MALKVKTKNRFIEREYGKKPMTWNGLMGFKNMVDVSEEQWVFAGALSLYKLVNYAMVGGKL